MNTGHNTSEAYKSVIDFNKTIISISSSILAALIAYLVYQKISFRLLNFISLIFLVCSIIFSIAGFGKAIMTIKDNYSRKATIVLSNFGAFFLILGILAILLIKEDKQTIDNILYNVENSTTRLGKHFSPEKCIKIELRDENYIFTYKTDSTINEVFYSTSINIITMIR